MAGGGNASSIFNQKRQSAESYVFMPRDQAAPQNKKSFRSNELQIDVNQDFVNDPYMISARQSTARENDEGNLNAISSQQVLTKIEIS